MSVVLENGLSEEVPQPAPRLGLWPLVVGLLVVLATAALFLGYTKQRAGVWLSAPLDDTFIHFQYAKQLARGHVLQYNDGDAPSTGATSLLYLFLLAPGWLVGFRGVLLLAWGWLVAAGLHLAGGLALFGLVQRLTGRRGLAWTGLLAFLLCGPVLWGAYSQMEVGLFSALVLLTLGAAAREEEGGPPPRPSRRLLVWGCLLALVRPEGALLAGGLSLWLLWRHLAESPAPAEGGLLARARRLPRALWAARRTLYPLAAGVAMLLFFLALTGRLGTNASIKSHLSALPDEPGRYLETTVGWLPMTLEILLEKFPRALLPLTTLLALGGLALWAAQSGRRRARCGALVLGWLVLLTLFYSLAIARRDHFDRYYLPYFALVLVPAWWALGQLARRGEAAARAAVIGSAVLLVFMLPDTLFWARRFGDNCRDLAEQHFRAAAWLREKTPPTTRIAVNDAGAIPYLSGRYTYDLVGLVHNAFYQRKTAMPNNVPVWEALESLPHRPELIVAYREWIPDLADLPVFVIEKTFPLPNRSMVANEVKIAWRMRWDLLLDSHALPLQAGRRREQDQLDVADLASEAAHRYRRLDAGRPEGHLGQARIGGRVLVDGGRLVRRGEAFVLRAVPGQGALLLLRTSGPGPLDLDVQVNGRAAGRWQATRGPGLQEHSLPLPAALVDRERLEVRVTARAPFPSLHYWLAQ